MIAHLILISALSAYADRPIDAVPLVNPYLNATATWAQTVWPDIAPAQVKSIMCIRAKQPVCTVIGQDPGTGTDINECLPVAGAFCVASSEQTRSAANVLSDVVNGRSQAPSPDQIAADGSSVTTTINWRRTFVHGATLSPLLTIINEVLSIPIDGLRSVTVLENDGSYTMRGSERWERTAQQWLLCLRDGTCAGITE